MEIARLAEEACYLYQTNGNPEAGALCLDKAAKMIETDYPERAIDLYRRGVDVTMVRDCFDFTRTTQTSSKEVEAPAPARGEDIVGCSANLRL